MKPLRLFISLALVLAVGMIIFFFLARHAKVKRMQLISEPVGIETFTKPALTVTVPDTTPVSAGNIDTHMHFGGKLSSGEMKSLYASAAGYLIENMDAVGLEKAILVTVLSPSATLSGEGIEQLTAATIALYPDRLFRMAGGAQLGTIIEATDPDAVTPSIQKTFRTQAVALLDAGAIGFGEMITLHPCLGSKHNYQFAPPDHPLFLLLADIAAERGVPIDLHAEAVAQTRPMPENIQRACDQNPDTLEATIPAIESLLAHNRSANIVWQHIGWDNTGEMTVKLLRRLLETHSNLFLALKVEERGFQVGTNNQVQMLNRIVDSNGEIGQDWLDLFEDFPDRFMIGADEFVDASGERPVGAASLDATWKMVDQLPADLEQKFGSENAARVYGLE